MVGGAAEEDLNYSILSFLHLMLDLIDQGIIVLCRITNDLVNLMIKVDYCVDL